MCGISPPARALYLGEGGGQPGENPARDQGRDAPGRRVASCPAHRSVWEWAKKKIPNVIRVVDPDPAGSKIV
jgi:hypothetical protein